MRSVRAHLALGLTFRGYGLWAEAVGGATFSLTLDRGNVQCARTLCPLPQTGWLDRLSSIEPLPCELLYTI